MHLIDWLIVALPVLVLLFIGYRVQSHVKGVADFLAGGRVAGRYVLCVSAGEAAIGLISVVGMFEFYFRTGVALYFWQHLSELAGLIMALTGFMIYRYRETRALTMAQFFEVRYSRNFRIFTGILAFMTGVVNYALFPAVGGRFLMYFCGLPDTFPFLGFDVDTFGFLMAFFLCVALFIVLLGGQLTTMVTDCVQGLFGYIGFGIITVCIFSIFSYDQIGEAMLDRPEGESFLNPFDIGNFTDFNFLYVFIGLIGLVYGRMSWQGTQGFNSAATSPHEQKMAAVLGTWRSGFTYITIILMALAAYTFLNHPDFSAGASNVHQELTSRINFDNPTTTETIRNQMMVPVALREIFPIGVTGVFVAMMIFLLISTDTSYLHSWGSIFIQDVVMPLRKKPITPERQILFLRLAILGIAIFAWFFSMYFGQVTYILMFFALTGSIYVGGAGIVIIGGLYSRRGTTIGAWAAMITGATLGVTGFLGQKFWSTHVYPWLDKTSPNFLVSLKSGLEGLGSKLPFVNWEVNEINFPITGQEVMLITIVSSTIVYFVVSLLTCREPYNLDKMLHRGEYNREHKQVSRPTTKRSLIGRIVSIDEEYTRGDRILAWSVFGYTIFKLLTFAFVAIWNLAFGIWSDQAWLNYFKYFTIPVLLGIGAITSVWFFIGGTWDLRRLFKNLKNIKRNIYDNGQVIGDQNAEDICFADVETTEKPAERIINKDNR
ncbi:sodium:solute symporter family protein [Cerasicoccus fimbriatus]|uniref:sodium:solute symporter family protein n=1 Tax=Cerasicoccus fimbriatus TaxID=3014554 RepID=UPI0022B2CE1F|nr:hypothetical protein [Cerasicoccus sp. TK19100]